VLTIQPAKNLQGKFELPPSNDLFFLAIITALSRKRAVSVTPVPVAPVIAQWETAFCGHCTFIHTDSTIEITPVTTDPSLRIAFDSTDLPWRDLSVYALLGMRKTVVFRTISEKRIATWKTQLARFGATLTTSVWEGTNCLALEETIKVPADETPLDESDLDALSGLMLGAGLTGLFTIESPYVSPLRALAQQFNFTLDVKNTVPKERDSLARRIQLMQQKSRKSQNGQQFSVRADFSPSEKPTPDPLPLTLPGDALLGTVFTAAKCLYTKSSFVISNMPLESWATPVFPFIRKMGCKVSVQETGRTSFGSVGIVQVQSGEMLGRKCECAPIGRYAAYLPSLVVIASFAKGESVFRELTDLRSDTPDGIDELEHCIRLLGARHGEMPDGIVLQGGYDFDGFDMPEPLPHGIAAVFAIAATHCLGASTINDERLVTHYPAFASYLEHYFEYRAPHEKN